jgi:uncharacterized protein YecT (DUF1311 family)
VFATSSQLLLESIAIELLALDRISIFVSSRNANVHLPRIVVGIVSGLVLWPLGTARAQDCRHSANQREWNICAGNNAAAADHRLEQLLTEISSRADSARRARLQAVQQTWKAFRDNDCQWQADAFTGGSIQPAIYAECILALTEARISDLKLQLCEGFGARGPCAESRKYDLPMTKPLARR